MVCTGSRRREGSKMQQGFVAHVHWKQTQILLCEHDSGIGVMSSSWVLFQGLLPGLFPCLGCAPVAAVGPWDPRASQGPGAANGK
ncbi:uncharacterized protein ACIBXB_016065 isoform 4-T8 [Morphnus guianensis]